MSDSTDTPELDPCGCCEAALPPPLIFNRPGLPALGYRIGTHPTFLRRMLARLPAQTVPPEDPNGPRPLARLTTRSGDDPAMALLDVLATAADVLTFYQERIANEGYLRTATERRSILELARAIGYELRPGVAAGAFLAFRVEDAPGAPGVAAVPAGTQVQSIPGQGQLPQTFETGAEITARAEWNALRPRLTQPQPLEVTATSLYLAGTTTKLKAGDMLLVSVAAGGPPQVKARHIHRVTVESERQRTRVDFEEQPAPLPPLTVAPKPAGQISLMQMTMNAGQVQNTIVGQSWTESSLGAFLSIQGWQSVAMLAYLAAPPAPSLPPADSGVFAFRQRVGFFGHNAPKWGSLPPEGSVKSDPYPEPPGDWDKANGNTGRNIWEDSQGTSYATSEGYDVFLERELSELVTNSWVVFEGGALPASAYRISQVTEASLADYGLSAKATGLALKEPDGTTAPDKAKAFKTRKSTAYVQSERLELAELPIGDVLAAGDTSLQLDRMVVGLSVGQPLLLTGERVDLPGVTASEVVFLTDIQHSGGFTTLAFSTVPTPAPPRGLSHPYVRKTVTLNANVASATHGETVKETLGSGDSSQSNQRFRLGKPPLTYVSASTASGARSTLRLRVNGVEWAEVPRLFGLDARSQSYSLRIDDDGKTTAVFGDGETGARLPTGSENVTATYRSGIGLAGMVDADKLTLLKTRPLGIRGVTNPLPATGAAEPETRDQARGNAPGTVLTLERIVSLRDFEDFARSFAGIGKATAVPLWQGETRLVHVTTAAEAAAVEPGASPTPLASHVVDSQSDLFRNLVAAIGAARDPSQQYVVESYQPLFFNLKARVKVDPRLEAAAVFTAVEDALKAAFAFEQRAFGQPVTAAEILTVMQNTGGVVAADLVELYRVDDPPASPQDKPADLLPADPVQTLGDKAQLLLINPAGITLEEMTP